MTVLIDNIIKLVNIERIHQYATHGEDDSKERLLHVMQGLLTEAFNQTDTTIASNKILKCVTVGIAYLEMLNEAEYTKLIKGIKI